MFLSGVHRNHGAGKTDAQLSQGPDYTKDSNHPDQPHPRLSSMWVPLSGMGAEFNLWPWLWPMSEQCRRYDVPWHCRLEIMGLLTDRLTWLFFFLWHCEQGFCLPCCQPRLMACLLAWLLLLLPGKLNLTPKQMYAAAVIERNVSFLPFCCLASLLKRCLFYVNIWLLMDEVNIAQRVKLGI